MAQFPNKKDIARLSRDKSFLLRATLFLVVVSLILASSLSLLTHMPVVNDHDPTQKEGITFSQILTIIRNPGLSQFHLVAQDSRFLETESDTQPADEEKDQPEKTVFFKEAISEASFLSDTEKTLLTQLSRGLHVKDEQSDAIKKLIALPEQLRFRNEFLGDIHFVAGKKDKALAYYLAEGKAFLPASYSQRSALLELWRIQDFPRLRNLLEQPGFRDALDAGELMPILADARDFSGLLKVTLRDSLSQFTFPELIPPLFTALIWALVLLSFCPINRKMISLSFAAFVLGMMSAILTLFAYMIQERIQGFNDSNADDPMSQIIYWVAGVGLREESLKLLCFIPIAFWILPGKNNLHALILAGMIGLGFACEENFAYFAGESRTDVVWSRFISANALHFALTGVVGFHFFKMISRKGKGWENFLINFLIVVIAHGLYDALLSMPVLADYSSLWIIALALIAYMYFDLLRDHIDTAGLHRRVSPLGVFVLGSAMILCSTLIFSAGLNPFGKAFGDFALSIGGMIPLAFAFISRFRDI